GRGHAVGKRRRWPVRWPHVRRRRDIRTSRSASQAPPLHRSSGRHAITKLGAYFQWHTLPALSFRHPADVGRRPRTLLGAQIVGPIPRINSPTITPNGTGTSARPHLRPESVPGERCGFPILRPRRPSTLNKEPGEQPEPPSKRVPQPWPGCSRFGRLTPGPVIASGDEFFTRLHAHVPFPAPPGR